MAKRQGESTRRYVRSDESFRRRSGGRALRPIALIVCEGAETEYRYFRAWKSQAELATVTIDVRGGKGQDASVVEAAIKARDERKKRFVQAKKQGQSADPPFELVWCVFDRDSFPANNFNNAVARAEAHGLHVAYSNQAFEYWLLLHFENNDGHPMPRTDYMARLNAHLEPFGLRYDGNGTKLIGPELFALLQAAEPISGRTRRKMAIGRARKIDQEWNSQGTPPAQQESTTLVYKLVQEIQRHMAK